VVLPARLQLSDDATIGEIVRKKLGRELTYQLVEPMIGGIQAGRIDELSAKSVFPALWDAARKGGSLMRALRSPAPVIPGPNTEITSSDPSFYTLFDGVGSLASELARQLVERGVVLRHGVNVTALRRTPAGNYPWEVDTLNTTTPANAIVLATPAPVVGALIGAHDPSLEELRQIESAGAAMVTFAIAKSEITLPTTGTGILVPLGSAWKGDGSMMVTAVTLLDRKWPHLARDHDVVLRAHVGRSDDSRWAEMTDEELVLRVGQELGELLPRFGAWSESLVQRWPHGLPQYRAGHEVRVQRARVASARISVALAGSAYDGVGIPASVGSGRSAARDVRSMINAS
jgi:oxygen-dependent protoporphyrinogen oxidase